LSTSRISLCAYRNRQVRQHVGSTSDAIELFFLPTYAPKLNPVEHLWASLKRHTLANFCPAPMESSN